MEKRKTGLLKLLKFVEGKWKVVDYGVPRLARLYILQGYRVKS